jgi:branched-chain amino acid transport system substrate-binding protein
MRTKKYTAPALLAISALLLAGCAPTVEEQQTGSTDTDTDNNTSETTEDTQEELKDPVSVAVITTLSGAFAPYGEAYKAGLEAGLDYVTDGTMVVNGHPIEVEFFDDALSADTAVSTMKDAIGQGTQIIAGTVASGIALQLAEQAAQNQVLFISGPAAADAITGVNDYTFRSGRQTYQDVATAGTFLGDPAGQDIVVFAQDTAFGQGNVAGVEAVLGGQGANVSSILVPEDATEFTPFAQQINDASPDLVFVAWAGTTSGAMWEALTQQGVFETAPVVTGLGDVSTYGAYAAAGTEISFLNHYFAGAAGTAVEQEMLTRVEAAGEEGDLFTPDGFLAAQMIAEAIKASPNDVDAMIAALEGLTLEGPKGTTTIRAEDHAVIQPMFQASLVNNGGVFTPELIAVIDGETVAPPLP